MFNMGMSEMAMIAALALLLIGPKQLPEVARMVGRFLNDIKRSAGSFTDDIKKQVDIDHQKIFDMRKQANQQPPPKEEKKSDPSSDESES